MESRTVSTVQYAAAKHPKPPALHTAAANSTVLMPLPAIGAWMTGTCKAKPSRLLAEMVIIESNVTQMLGPD